MMAGMVASRLRRAARQRRSPAMSSYSLSAERRTRTAAGRPSRGRMQSAMRGPLRRSAHGVGGGWHGRRDRELDQRSPIPRTSVGIKAPKPSTQPAAARHRSPLSLAPGRRGAPGRGVENDDGLSERRSLRQPDGARDDATADPVPEVGAHLCNHLVRQAGAGVVHGQNDRRHLEARVEVGPDPVDVASSWPRPSRA